MPTAKVCPECGGRKRLREPGHPRRGRRGDSAQEKNCGFDYIDACPCCRGLGFILFGRMYPPLDWLREAYRDWLETEVLSRR